MSSDLHQGRHHRHHVLLLTEENDSRELLSFLLKAGGFGVTLSKTADEAVLSLLKGQAEAIVLDLPFQPGKGQLGLEFIRHSWPSIPIITLVPPEFRQLGEEAVKSGAAAYLTKPVDFALMKGLLREALPQSASGN